MTPPTTKAATPSSSSSDDARKPGVASNAEMRHFLEQNQDVSKIVIVDARNPDFSVEPSDALYGSLRGEFPIADCGTEKRPNALNVPFERTKKRLSGANAEDILRTLEKDRAIITHCGGGGRGQKSKEWLEKEGFTNVVNGGGPQVKELWEMFGHL
jgi:rhodanese-related sulfurtransferase